MAMACGMALGAEWELQGTGRVKLLLTEGGTSGVVAAIVMRVGTGRDCGDSAPCPLGHQKPIPVMTWLPTREGGDVRTPTQCPAGEVQGGKRPIPCPSEAEEGGGATLRRCPTRAGGNRTLIPSQPEEGGSRTLTPCPSGVGGGATWRAHQSGPPPWRAHQSGPENTLRTGLARQKTTGAQIRRMKEIVMNYFSRRGQARKSFRILKTTRKAEGVPKLPLPCHN